MRHLLSLLPLAFLASCATRPDLAPPTTVRSVDLSRYAGVWYELASYPQWFQRGCASAIARYGEPVEGRVAVTNFCLKPDGSHSSINGFATPVPGSNQSKLLVEFDTWFGGLIPKPDRGNYWIIHLEPDYRHAIVASPDRESLWILSRRTQISRAEWNRLLGIIRAKGFDPDRLKTDAHTEIQGA